MASKKSKVLAIAFCAAVMAGIYANPVMAQDQVLENPTSGSSITIRDNGGIRIEVTDKHVGDISIKDGSSHFNFYGEIKANDVVTTEGNNLDDVAEAVEAVEKQNTDQNSRLDGVEDINNQQNSRLDGVEDVNNQQNSRLDGVEDVNNQQNSRLDGVEDVNNQQNSRLDGVEDVNNQQNSRLDAHDVSIKNHEAVMGVTDKTGLESAYEGATYIDKNDTMVEADRKLDTAISDVNSRVDGLENRVDGLEDRIDKVGAMAAAIANLRTMGYDPAAPTEVAVGVGQYRDETGMALGLFHYPNRDFMLSLSVSTSGDEYMGGIGATWKFGRKSPEKVAEIKKAQAEADARRAEEQKLAKAEEMKKAAKEAKVQAQMERHAKMLAEQEAQAEA